MPPVSGTGTSCQLILLEFVDPIAPLKMLGQKLPNLLQ
jgi:hypothetical protein